jgi:hypothetical protein
MVKNIVGLNLEKSRPTSIIWYLTIKFFTLSLEWILAPRLWSELLHRASGVKNYCRERVKNLVRFDNFLKVVKSIQLVFSHPHCITTKT